MTALDFEAWRCCHSSDLMCPLEGCAQSEGCARDNGWDGTQPGPANGANNVRALSRETDQ